ncbi:MAG: EAL domain-containing protein [Gammaproteobacteria bacterium]|nr:EAL domain-containing protein [Gammaproteobacteria bacterium]MDH5801938.1 EAL domain-containing protein [Gammaproteobacteria bacterium]
MSHRPYIEPSIRVIAGILVILAGAIAVLRPEWQLPALGFLIVLGVSLFQSGFTGFCLTGKLLQSLGFRSEMAQIRAMAIHDPLTKLPNRNLMEDRVRLALTRALRSDEKVGLMIIDLDAFKHVNDVYSHKVGDQLLVTMAKTIKENIRSYDTLCRWGGDEFALLLPDLKSAAEIHYIGNKILQAAAENRVPEQDVNTTLSIGAAVFPDDAVTQDTLFMQADKALHYAKRNGRNNIQIFHALPEAQSGILNIDLTARLSAAVHNHSFKVYFQPVIDAKTNQVCQIEALARWYDHTHGWIDPSLFVPMAENIGLMEDLGLQIITSAVEFYKDQDWSQKVKLSVNLSAREFFSRPFKQGLRQIIRSHNLLAEQLIIEITDADCLDTNNAKEIITQLHTEGFNVVLDNFGTGFSPMSLLQELDVEALKIDRAFISQITKHTPAKQGEAMVKTMIELGRAMQLKVTAKGVEDSQTADRLLELGVDYLQGYYFSPPLPGDECKEFVENNFSLNALDSISAAD